MRALSIQYMSETGACTEHTRKELMHALIAGMKFEKVPSKHAEHTREELTRALSVRVRN